MNTAAAAVPALAAATQPGALAPSAPGLFRSAPPSSPGWIAASRGAVAPIPRQPFRGQTMIREAVAFTMSIDVEHPEAASE
ncbi:hypothetical protein EBL87_16280 [Cereibacter sphaeroides]|nr:hypothetical protein EBL87_16280 [Cereibacter sphaeroides]